MLSSPPATAQAAPGRSGPFCSTCQGVDHRAVELFAQFRHQDMRVDDVVECIQTLGAGVLMVKIDLERQIPVHPSDHHLLGITWELVPIAIAAAVWGFKGAVPPEPAVIKRFSRIPQNPPVTRSNLLSAN